MQTHPPTPTETLAYEVIRLAQLKADTERFGMNDSAKLAVEDAVALFNRGDFGSAHKRAVDSLDYSIGLFERAHLLQAVSS